MTLLLLVACAQPVHMQYDFGRATWEAQRIQADLARASAAESVYPLSGEEAMKLRENVEKATTEAKTADVEATR